MKKIILFFIFALFFFKTYAQKDTCIVGVFVTDLYDFNLGEQSFSVTFWIWMNYKNDSLDLLNNAEIINAKESSYELATIENRGEYNYASQKGKATIKKKWNISNFPFDKQELKVMIESGDEDTSTLIFVNDVKNSQLDKNVELDGWQVHSFKTSSKIRTYKTNYGDPDIKGSSSFPLFEFSITLKRNSWGLFFKMFTGVYIAFCISMIVFIMGPENAERFGLLVGALFAAIGNKYIVDSILPETENYTLIDKVHTLTFVYIFFSILVTVIVYQLDRADKRQIAKITDWIVLAIFIISYVWINIVMVGGAM
jgi:hypothetical protein